jgi:hypothetical protein
MFYITFHCLDSNDNNGCNDETLVTDESTLPMNINETTPSTNDDNETNVTSMSSFHETMIILVNDTYSRQVDTDRTTQDTIDYSSTESFESNTMETITFMDSTTSRIISCVETEFECCPDGVTSAQVNKIIVYGRLTTV